MAEDTSRRKSNNPSRVLQSPEGEEGEDSAQTHYNDGEIIDIPDDETSDNNTKTWYHSSTELVPRPEPSPEDGGRGFVFRNLDEPTDLRMDVDQGINDHETGLQSGRPAQSLLPGRLSLKRRTNHTFNRQRHSIGTVYDTEPGYLLDGDSSQVRRQQRAVEPFVCRTPSSSGKKDASMQFPDDELAVLKEENDALRKENSELRKKVDRLVETIALNDALPNLLASLRGGPPSEEPPPLIISSTPSHHGATARGGASPSASSSTPSTITISKCQSLASEEPTLITSTPPSSSSSASVHEPGVPASEIGVPVSEVGVPGSEICVPGSDVGVRGSDVGVPVSEVGVLAQLQSIPCSMPQVSLSDRVGLPHIALTQVSLPHLGPPLDHPEMLPQHSQHQVHISQAPVIPVLAPAVHMSLSGQPPMVPPGAPSQLAIMQQSLPSQVPHSVAQAALSPTVLSQMSSASLAPVRIRGKIAPRMNNKHVEDPIEITLSNHVKVDKRLLDRCNHTNFRKLTSDLLMCLFPRKTLSRSTLGGTSNTISRTTGLPTNKTRLDPDKVEAILDYVQRVTGVPARAVKDAIRTKLNNEAKRMHRQLIFKRSMHYPTGSSGDPT